MKTLACALLLLASPTMCTFALGAEKMEGVDLHDSLDFTSNAGQVKLVRLGAGLRFKKVVFVKAKVYVAQLFGDSPAKYKHNENEALGSLLEQKHVAIQLTFLRSVDAETIQKAYKEGFKENDISTEEAAIKEFLVAAGSGGDAKEGSIISISAEQLSGERERIIYTGPNKKPAEVSSSAGLIKKIFSLFLGKPGDSGLESLKKDLTS